MDILQIKSKVKKLMEQNNELKAQIADLHKQMEEKDKNIQQLWQKCVDTQIKYDNLVSAKVLARDSDEAQKARKRLSGLVRNIDRCIALLNKQE
jgi:chromosome segregation ATPase